MSSTANPRALVTDASDRGRVASDLMPNQWPTVVSDPRTCQRLYLLVYELSTGPEELRISLAW